MEITNLNNPKQGESTIRLEKVAYSLQELSEITPMSQAFYRAEIAAGRLIAKSFGTRLCIMRSDWLDYLENQKRWTPKKRVRAARVTA